MSALLSRCNEQPRQMREHLGAGSECERVRADHPLAGS